MNSPTTIDDGDRMDPRDYARSIGRAIDASPGPTHAAAVVVDRLDGIGFTELDESRTWPRVPDRWYVRRGGAVLAGTTPGSDQGGYRIVGAHTDSPTLRIKPRPDTGTEGWRQLGVEIYGGVLLNSWLDRDLGLSGQLAVSDDEGVRMVPVLIDEPVLRIPQLAIHLDGDIRERGLKLDAQRHMAPVWGLGDPTEGDLRDHLASVAGVAADRVLAWDLIVHDVTPATLSGVDGEFLVSGRLDDLFSVFCATEGLVTRLETDGASDHGAVLCFFDHEEVGSVSASGAAGSMLATTLERIARGRGDDADLHAARLARSLCISADMAHATHPNFADRHEPDHAVRLNEGPVVKANANQRYTTDAEGAAQIMAICGEAGVPVQQFVSRSDLPCGSTIGPVTAGGLGVATVDVGAPQLAMHSCREMAGSADALLLHRLFTAFF